MSFKIVVITGCSRGLGLGMASAFAEKSYRVFAGSRTPSKSKALQALSDRYPNQVVPFEMDVVNQTSIDQAVHFVKAKTDSLDILINNAGVYGESTSHAERKLTPLGSLDLEDIQNTFNTNTLGPLRVTAAFLPLLKNGAEKKIVHITSKMGSIQDNSSGGSYGYRLSKVALNMLSRNIAHKLADENFVSVVLHPGWVRTDMGGQGAPIDIPTSVKGMISVIENLTPGQNGSFFDYEGNVVPY